MSNAKGLAAIHKRWKREHGKRTKPDPPKPPDDGFRFLVPPPGFGGVPHNAPFLRLPGDHPQDEVLFNSADGMPITVAAVEMVYNDSMLIDATQGHGTYRKYTCMDNPRQLEVYEYALKAYKGASW